MSADLFPPQDVVISYRLLFGVYSGIVPDGIEDLATGDIDWAGDASVLLSHVKRRTAAESLNLPRRAVRLLEQSLAHSALLRSLACLDAASGKRPLRPAARARPHPRLPREPPVPARTLAIELAYRPGGVLAAKFAAQAHRLATTEGYASRRAAPKPNCSPRSTSMRADRNLALLWPSSGNYQQGIMPAGPGARELTDFFASIDAGARSATPRQPQVERSDRESATSSPSAPSVLHLGTANYCWFTDPSRALCLQARRNPGRRQAR